MKNAICDDATSLHLASMMQLGMKSDNPFYKLTKFLWCQIEINVVKWLETFVMDENEANWESWKGWTVNKLRKFDNQRKWK